MSDTEVYDVASGKYVPLATPVSRKAKNPFAEPKRKAAKAEPTFPVPVITFDTLALCVKSDALPQWGQSAERQAWIEGGATYLADMLAKAGHTVPDKVRVTVGFPFGSRKALGQAWYETASTDGHAEIFISPVLSDGPRILDVLLHELCHAICGKEALHGKEFRAVATSVGLTGKMTATIAGPELQTELERFVGVFGSYPVGAIDPANSGRKKQTTRMIKCECEECGYSCRTSRQWLEMGAPICPIDNVPMKAQ